MGIALAITRTEQNAADLRLIAGKCHDGAQVRRLLAVAFALKGRSRSVAAEQSGMDQQTLRDWVLRYIESGMDGLKSRRSPGPVPTLTGERMAELRALVIKGPDPATHNVVRWQCLDLRAEVARQFSVTMHEDTIGKWLRQLGLTRLQPRPFHPKKDADAQEAFKQTSPAW